LRDPSATIVGLRFHKTARLLHSYTCHSSQVTEAPTTRVMPLSSRGVGALDRRRSNGQDLHLVCVVDSPGVTARSLAWDDLVKAAGYERYRFEGPAEETSYVQQDGGDGLGGMRR
jgi:hypothetical protein